MARDVKKIDAKGSFFIPAKLKDKLGSVVVVTNSIDSGYLCVYSQEHYEKEILPSFMNPDRNTAVPGFNKVMRTIIGEAREINVDAQGRVSVNSELWENIGAKPGDEICVFDIGYKLDICTKVFYDHEDHDLSNIVGLETMCYVKGL